MSDEDFRKRLAEDVKAYCGDASIPRPWDWFARRFYYLAGDFNDDKLFPQVKDRLAKIDRDHSTQQNFFYYWPRRRASSVPSLKNWLPTG